MPARFESSVFRRLSDQFELCAFGLSCVRREWEKFESEGRPVPVRRCRPVTLTRRAPANPVQRCGTSDPSRAGRPAPLTRPDSPRSIARLRRTCGASRRTRSVSPRGRTERVRGGHPPLRVRRAAPVRGGDRHRRRAGAGAIVGAGLAPALVRCGRCRELGHRHAPLVAGGDRAAARWTRWRSAGWSRERTTLALFDGENGLPPLILERAAELAVEKAREAAVGLVRVVGVRAGPFGGAGRRRDRHRTDGRLGARPEPVRGAWPCRRRPACRSWSIPGWRPPRPARGSRARPGLGPRASDSPKAASSRRDGPVPASTLLDGLLAGHRSARTGRRLARGRGLGHRAWSRSRPSTSGSPPPRRARRRRPGRLLPEDWEAHRRRAQQHGIAVDPAGLEVPRPMGPSARRRGARPAGRLTGCDRLPPARTA